MFRLGIQPSLAEEHHLRRVLGIIPIQRRHFPIQIDLEHPMVVPLGPVEPDPGSFELDLPRGAFGLGATKGRAVVTGGEGVYSEV